MVAKKYASATAFRRALEDRLQTMARKQGIDLQRLRRQVAFDRLLARFFSDDPAPWVLKGGYAMELRFLTARTTRDMDLTLRSRPSLTSQDSKKRNDAILQLLQEYAAFDLNDYFVYAVGQPMMELDAPLYGGARFPVEGRVDGRLFASFHVDVAVGDVLLEPLERMEGKDWLGFADIPPNSLRAICAEQQFAEKLHAYTQPRQNQNTRVRDLVDMVLLIDSGKLSNVKVGKAIHATFDRRHSHPLPKELFPPPPDWTKPFAAMAKECGIKEDIASAFATLQSFIVNI
jgi:predicted nucleotidyltransferase component of viral defense system